ncbi:MAG: hypothetical protein PGN11_06020 [Quadrisphaera sp.]
MRKHVLSTTAALGLVAASMLSPLSAAQASGSGNTLVVDASGTLRPVTHVAAGTLYGIADASTPSAAQLMPLHLNQITQPPPGVQQLGNGATTPCCDGLKVASTVTAVGAQQYFRMPDVYPDFPYKWVSWDDWLGKVDTMVKARLAAKDTTNISGWEIWNEPDGTWDTQKAGPYNDGWTRTYREIRSLDTVTPIIGPGFSQYNHDLIKSFLTQAKADGTLPDVVVWHELSQGWASIDEHVADYRALEKELGISPRPISVNEYAWTDQVDVPSAALHYIAQFERTGVANADRAYWYEAGTADGLFYNGQPTASYYMYKWYGDMAGKMLPVTASGDLDGIASLDSTRKIVNVVFGGDYGDDAVKVTGLGSFGSQVKATLTASGITGRQTAASAPQPVSTQTLTVASDGSVTVPVTGMDSRAAYQLLVTPAAGPTSSWQQTYEAENATVVNAQTLPASSASNGYYVGRIDGTGDARKDSFVDFIVNVPTAGKYTMGVRYANGGTSTATQGLAYNGGGWSTISYPPTGSWGTFTTNATASAGLDLKAGYNVIRLAKGSPNFAGGSGYAELDSITLTQS